MNKIFLKSSIVLLTLMMIIFNLNAMSCGEKTSDQDQEQMVNKKLPKGNTDVKLPKLLDLGAHKCIPCKKMTPILDELKEEYKGIMDVEFVDVWQPENKAVAQKHQIKSIPTQIYFDETGKEIWRHVGFLGKDEILTKWKELGFEFNESADVSCNNDCEFPEGTQNENGGCCGK